MDLPWLPCQKLLAATFSRGCRRLLVIACVGVGLFAMTSTYAATENADPIRIHHQGKYVDVGPLPASVWKGLQVHLEEEGSHFLVMRVEGARSGILGEYRRVMNDLRFEPRFALRPALTYVVEFNPAGALATLGHPATQRISFQMPAPASKRPERIHQVFPTSDELPENLLKFYIQFSGPMSRGEAYRRIRLLDQTGEAQIGEAQIGEAQISEAIELPFLELGQELWDPEGTRLTLLFDPGRIKRGLKPRQDIGQVLQAGRRYRLIIDSAWPDAAGQPLAAGHEKNFQVTKADYQQPDPAAWQLKIPSVKTQDPLVITFREALDRGMLERVFRIKDAEGRKVETETVVITGEQTVQLKPKLPWQAGQFRLCFDPALEDVAGNSVGRAFEVRPDEQEARPPVIVERTFEISH